MVLGNFGDLEEIILFENRKKFIELFQEVIVSSQEYYNNQYVYFYTYLGGYLYRKQDYNGVLQVWVDVVFVIKK